MLITTKKSILNYLKLFKDILNNCVKIKKVFVDHKYETEENHVFDTVHHQPNPKPDLFRM